MEQITHDSSVTVTIEIHDKTDSGQYSAKRVVELESETPITATYARVSDDGKADVSATYAKLNIIDAAIAAAKTAGDTYERVLSERAQHSGVNARLESEHVNAARRAAELESEVTS